MYDPALHAGDLLHFTNPHPFPPLHPLLCARTPLYLQATVKQCNQALSKYPKHGLFTILKAYALDCMGNASEALVLAQEVSESGTADAEVLHHTSNLLRSNGEYNMLLQMYQKSAALQPQDIGLQQVQP